MKTTAWKIKTKLVEAMRLVSMSERLDGRVEMDDAYLGGERSGGKTARGSLGKSRSSWRCRDGSSFAASPASSAAG